MKKIKRLALLSITIISFLPAMAQGEKGGRVFSSNINELYFMKYDAGYKVKARITDLSKVENKFPEQLLESLLSSTSYEWDILNTLDGKNKTQAKSDKHYANIKTMNKDLNYFELKHKLSFDIEGVPTALLKFYIVMEGKPEVMSAVMVMQQYNGRWYKTSTKMIFSLAMITWRLKTEELYNLIEGKIDDTMLKEVNTAVFVNGKLDFSLLSKEMESWYTLDTPANKAKIDYFKDPKTLF